MHPYMTQQLAAGRAAEAVRRAEAARVAGMAAVAKGSTERSSRRSGVSLQAGVSKVRAWRAARRPVAVPAPAVRPRVDGCY